MHFLVTWDFIDTSDEAQERVLQLFAKWQPGPGTFHGFYGYADGGGGCAIIEAADASVLARTVAPWTAYLAFQIRPLVDVQESAAINAEGLAWRQAN